MLSRYTGPIPRRRWSTNVEGNRHPVEEGTRDEDEIFDIVKKSCLNENTIPRFWKVRHTTIVRNTKWQKTFREKRQEILNNRRDPHDAYAFGLVRKDTLADDVCKKGKFKAQELHEPLGDRNKGVNLSVHADVLMSWARKKQYSNPTLIIYKILKGRASVQKNRQMTNGDLYYPTPNHECHVLREPTVDTKDELEDAMINSQIFLYEFDDNCLPTRHPRHCLPYAAICVNRDTSLASEAWKQTSDPATSRQWLEHVEKNVKSATRERGLCRENSELESPKDDDLSRSAFVMSVLPKDSIKSAEESEDDVPHYDMRYTSDTYKQEQNGQIIPCANGNAEENESASDKNNMSSGIKSNQQDSDSELHKNDGGEAEEEDQEQSQFYNRGAISNESDSELALDGHGYLSFGNVSQMQEPFRDNDPESSNYSDVVSSDAQSLCDAKSDARLLKSIQNDSNNNVEPKPDQFQEENDSNYLADESHRRNSAEAKYNPDVTKDSDHSLSIRDTDCCASEQIEIDDDDDVNGDEAARDSDKISLLQVSKENSDTGLLEDRNNSLSGEKSGTASTKVEQEGVRRLWAGFASDNMESGQCETSRDPEEDTTWQSEDAPAKKHSEGGGNNNNKWHCLSCEDVEIQAELFCETTRESKIVYPMNKPQANLDSKMARVLQLCDESKMKSNNKRHVSRNDKHDEQAIKRKPLLPENEKDTSDHDLSGHKDTGPPKAKHKTRKSKKRKKKAHTCQDDNRNPYIEKSGLSPAFESVRDEERKTRKRRKFSPSSGTSKKSSYGKQSSDHNKEKLDERNGEQDSDTAAIAGNRRHRTESVNIRRDKKFHKRKSQLDSCSVKSDIGSMNVIHSYEKGAESDARNTSSRSPENVQAPFIESNHSAVHCTEPSVTADSRKMSNELPPLSQVDISVQDKNENLKRDLQEAKLKLKKYKLRNSGAYYNSNLSHKKATVLSSSPGLKLIEDTHGTQPDQIKPHEHNNDLFKEGSNSDLDIEVNGSTEIGLQDVESTHEKRDQSDGGHLSSESLVSDFDWTREKSNPSPTFPEVSEKKTMCSLQADGSAVFDKVRSEKKNDPVHHFDNNPVVIRMGHEEADHDEKTNNKPLLLSSKRLPIPNPTKHVDGNQESVRAARLPSLFDISFPHIERKITPLHNRNYVSAVVDASREKHSRHRRRRRRRRRYKYCDHGESYERENLKQSDGSLTLDRSRERGLWRERDRRSNWHEEHAIQSDSYTGPYHQIRPYSPPYRHGLRRYTSYAFNDDHVIEHGPSNRRNEHDESEDPVTWTKIQFHDSRKRLDDRIPVPLLRRVAMTHSDEFKAKPVVKDYKHRSGDDFTHRSGDPFSEMVSRNDFDRSIMLRDTFPLSFPRDSLLDPHLPLNNEADQRAAINCPKTVIYACKDKTQNDVKCSTVNQVIPPLPQVAPPSQPTLPSANLETVGMGIVTDVGKQEETLVVDYGHGNFNMTLVDSHVSDYNHLKLAPKRPDSQLPVAHEVAYPTPQTTENAPPYQHDQRGSAGVSDPSENQQNESGDIIICEVIRRLEQEMANSSFPVDSLSDPGLPLNNEANQRSATDCPIPVIYACKETPQDGVRCTTLNQTPREDFVPPLPQVPPPPNPPLPSAYLEHVDMVIDTDVGKQEEEALVLGYGHANINMTPVESHAFNFNHLNVAQKRPKSPVPVVQENASPIFRTSDNLSHHQGNSAGVSDPSENQQNESGDGKMFGVIRQLQQEMENSNDPEEKAAFQISIRLIISRVKSRPTTLNHAAHAHELRNISLTDSTKESGLQTQNSPTPYSCMEPSKNRAAYPRSPKPEPGACVPPLILNQSAKCKSSSSVDKSNVDKIPLMGNPPLQLQTDNNQHIESRPAIRSELNAMELNLESVEVELPCDSNQQKVDGVPRIQLSQDTRGAKSTRSSQSIEVKRLKRRAEQSRNKYHRDGHKSFNDVILSTPATSPDLKQPVIGESGARVPMDQESHLGTSLQHRGDNSKCQEKANSSAGAKTISGNWLVETTSSKTITLGRVTGESHSSRIKDANKSTRRFVSNTTVEQTICTGARKLLASIPAKGTNTINEDTNIQSTGTWMRKPSDLRFSVDESECARKANEDRVNSRSSLIASNSQLELHQTSVAKNSGKGTKSTPAQRVTKTKASGDRAIPSSSIGALIRPSSKKRILELKTTSIAAEAEKEKLNGTGDKSLKSHQKLHSRGEKRTSDDLRHPLVKKRARRSPSDFNGTGEGKSAVGGNQEKETDSESVRLKVGNRLEIKKRLAEIKDKRNAVIRERSVTKSNKPKLSRHRQDQQTRQMSMAERSVRREIERRQSIRQHDRRWSRHSHDSRDRSRYDYSDYHVRPAGWRRR